MVQYDVKRVTKGTENFMVSFDFTKTPITQVADYIIIAASKNKTSDIHFDPREDGLMVRFRIDGDCQDYTFIPKAYERNLTTRLKLLANMNITETRLPQDGAIKGQFGDAYLDMRVSCLPTNEGEKIVIRILDYSRSLQGIESLGFHPKNLEKIKHMMGVPNGIILVTGATGSGKSTTTYSMLSELNKPETNVITVEDPVEMNLEGINQVQVNSEIGMTFAAALRSILRQDPNIILIGEIRDSETAQIAVRASITGHLVLSTLHTNNALSTIERLLDMNVERYLLSTALTGIISQRLAKQLCPNCRYQREATKYEKKVFKNFLHQDVEMVWDANSKGCDNCRKGYRGRIAIHEVLELDEHIRTSLNNDKLEKEELIKMVYTSKTITMLQDALIKALEGQTSFEEVYKNIEIENEDEDNYVQELSDITIKQTIDKSSTEEKTEEDFMGEEQQNSGFTQEYEIPKINTTEPIKETKTVVSEKADESKFKIPTINNETQNEKTSQKNNISNENDKNIFEMPTISNETQENNLEYTTVTPNIEATDEIYNQPEKITNEINNEQEAEEKTTNGTSYEENPIVPIIEIKTEQDNSIKPNFKLEKLDTEEEKNTTTEDNSSENTNPKEVNEQNEETKKFEYDNNLKNTNNSIENLDNLYTINEKAMEEALIPNIQAISAITDVTNTSTDQEITGSSILTDPGIRIADDGSINKSAEIDANPILPNYNNE